MTTGSMRRHHPEMRRESEVPARPEPFAPTGDGSRQLARAAGRLAMRSGELVEVLEEAVARQSPEPQNADTKCREQAEVCEANIRGILLTLTDEDTFDPTTATQTGVARARNNEPLGAAVESDRIAIRRLWEVLREVIASEGGITAAHDRDALYSLTVKLHAAEDLYTNAMVTGYRTEQTRQLLGETSHRAILIDSLLQGQLHNRWALWSAAHHLRLPVTGPYIVFAVELPTVGAAGLPEMESKLRSLDVYSAWHTLPDLQVGIAHVKTDHHLQRALALVSRMVTSQVRVGVSAPFDDLHDSVHALHFAKVAMRGGTDAASPIAVFDGTLLAAAAVSSPDVMVKSARTVLDGFRDLPDDERSRLFETFQVWQDTDTSVRRTAELLNCHPNTVRQRLRRIERRTGRSLSRPRDVAELCLAFEVQRRLL